MTRVFIAWLTLAAMCVLLVFKVNLHSDLLFLDNVAVDLFYHGGAWSNWKITPAPAYFPDMLAYGLAYFVFPNPTQRIVFVCMIQALLLAWVCLYLAGEVKKSFSTNAKIFVLIVITAVVLVSANSSMWLFFESTNNHFAALIFPLICLAWIISFIKTRKFSALFVISGGVAIGTASTSIFLIAFTAPALIFLTASLLVFRAHRNFLKAISQIALAILIGHAMSMLLQKSLLTFNAMEGRPLFTPDVVLRSMGAFASATRITFSADNYYTFALALFLAICVVWVLVDWILGVRLSIVNSPIRSTVAELEVSGTNWAYGLSVTFLLVVLPVNIIGAIFSGGFADNWGYRYFTFPIALGALLSILLLDFKLRLNSRRVVLLGALCMMTLIGLGIASLKPLLRQADRPTYIDVANKGTRGVGDIVGSCIDQEEKKGFVFGAGIGDFWNARGLSYKTAKPLYILPIINDGAPFFHMVTLGPLINPLKYGIKNYNFAVMRRSGTTAAFDVTPDTLGHLLPRPTSIVTCANSDVELWLYRDTTLDTSVRRTIDQFLGREGILRSYRMTGPELLGNVGKVQSQSRVADGSTDGSGYLSYGPYITLPAGRYKVMISYSATEPGNKWDTGRFNLPEKSITLAGGEVPQGNGKINFSFETKSSLPGFEIRTWFGGRGRFAIEKIELQPSTSH